MAVQPWRKGIIKRIKNEADNIKRFWIEVAETEVFDFKAGQFVTLDLPIHEKPNKRWRSYSIASWPDGSNVFELVIVKMEGGVGTSYIFNEWKENSEVLFRGAQGVFVLPEPLEKDLFLICTGTGIAPFRSMLHYIDEHNVPHKKLYLIFGTRKKENLLYYPELTELAQRLPDFHYIPTLSREEWEGKTGYVHEIYEELIREKQPALFMLCGWKQMIDEARNRIIQAGYDRKSIHLELYG
jgi:ferredoxin-NADP reductase